MTIEQIKALVPDNWLQNNWDEFIAMAGKITKTLIISTAVNKQWIKPMKTLDDFRAFFEDEAKLKNITAEEVEYYFFEAGRLKARNYIFENQCVPVLPKGEDGKCIYSLEVLLTFVNSTVSHEALLRKID